MATAASVGRSDARRLKKVSEVPGLLSRRRAAVSRLVILPASSITGGFGCAARARRTGEVADETMQAWRLDDHHDHDDDGEEHRALRRRHPEEEDRGLECLDDQHAHDGAREAELAAHERGAAQHHREDRVELDELARRVGVGRLDVRGVDDARYAREHGAGGVGAPDDAARAHPRETARLGVDANGLREDAECSATLGQPDCRDRRDPDEEGEWQEQ